MTAKRYRVILDDDAIADLASIRDYITRRAPDTAVEFIDRMIDEIYDTLEIFPYGHQQREPTRHLERPMWPLPIGSFRVIYTIDEDGRSVRVVGIQHGSRNQWP